MAIKLALKGKQSLYEYIEPFSEPNRIGNGIADG